MSTDFDEKAETWDDDPAKVRRAQVVGAAIRNAVPLDTATRLLEYGAGTGLVSEALSEHVGRVTLAEPSTGMRDKIAENIGAGRLPPDAQVWDLDLSIVEPPDEEQFELIVTAMALHHIHDLTPVLNGFARLLTDGGHLCIVDLDKEDGSFHENDPSFDGHDGFGRAELTAQLDRAGFTGVRFEQCHEVEKDGRTYPLFLATCSRAAD